MINDIKEIYYSKEQLNDIVVRLGKKISEDYKDKNLLLVCILKGSVLFMADLMRAVTVPCKIDFMCVSSYGNGTDNNSSEINIIKDIDDNLEGFDVLLVEDILDSGRTLNCVKSVLQARNPESIRICTLLDKPERRVVDIKADYSGAEVPDAFVVGYGLDYAEVYRNLPFIGVLREEIYTDNEEQ